MTSQVYNRIAHELSSEGYSHTSFRELNLVFDDSLVENISSVVATGSFSTSAAKLTERIEKQSMTIVQEPRALELGRVMIRPIVELLFADQPRALSEWELYAMNRYETGGHLGAHQDSVDKTVLVVGASGTREFSVYSRGESEGAFAQIERSFVLEAGSIMILDGEADPLHTVKCIHGPSVSAVLDVPALIR